MCDVLDLPRSTFYYESIEKEEENELDQVIQTIFSKSRNNYGTRKIKVELNKQGYSVSRRRIGWIINEHREIIGQSVGAYKTADLVYEALASINRDLRSI